MKQLLLLLTLLPLTIFAQTEQQGSESVSEWTSIQYNVTDVFAFATKFRTSYTYDISDIENGYSKTTPYIVSIGANYDF